MSFGLSGRSVQRLMCGFCMLVLVTSVSNQDNNNCSLTNIAQLNNFSFHLFSGKWHHILYLANGGTPVPGLKPRILEFLKLPGNSTYQGIMRVSGLLSPQRRAQSMNNVCCNASRSMQATNSPYRFQLKDPSISPEAEHYSDMWIVNTDYVNFAVILGCPGYYHNTTDCINPYCWVITRDMLLTAEMSLHIITTLSELCIQNENFRLSKHHSGCPGATGNVSVDGLQCTMSSLSSSPDMVNTDALDTGDNVTKVGMHAWYISDEVDTGDLVLSEPSEGVSRFVLEDGQGNPCLLASFNLEFRISYTAFQEDRIRVSHIRIGIDDQVSVSGSCQDANASVTIISLLWIKQAISLTLEFNTEQKDKGGTFWSLSRVGLNYDSNIYRLFPSAYQPAERHAISQHLHLYSTPVGFSYRCNTGDDINLKEYSDLHHKVILQNLQLQPAGIQGSDQFSRAIICQRDFKENERARENKIVLILIISFVAVLIILFVVALIVDRLKKYHRYRYQSIK